MEELEREINGQKEKQETIKDIIKIKDISLNPMLKLNEAYLVEIEVEKQRRTQEEPENQNTIEEDDDDLYDWSTGRPLPKY